MKSKLAEYPSIIDSDLDFEATRQHFGIGSCNSSIGEIKLPSKRTLVYMLQTRETDEPVELPNGEFARKCEHGIIVCGYKENPGCLAFFMNPRIAIIPDNEREGVINQLGKLGKKDYVEFWG